MHQMRVGCVASYCATYAADYIYCGRCSLKLVSPRRIQISGPLRPECTSSPVEIAGCRDESADGFACSQISSRGYSRPLASALHRTASTSSFRRSASTGSVATISQTFASYGPSRTAQCRGIMPRPRQRQSANARKEEKRVGPAFAAARRFIRSCSLIPNSIAAEARAAREGRAGQARL